ncbi:unnamed protein product, partial [Dicrocoelium dendriticum]
TSTGSSVTTISSFWLLGDGRQALLPNVPPSEYLNAVKEHRPADKNCKLARVTKLRRIHGFRSGCCNSELRRPFEPAGRHGFNTRHGHTPTFTH